jgi:hypothetical protein
MNFTEMFAANFQSCYLKDQIKVLFHHIMLVNPKARAQIKGY